MDHSNPLTPDPSWTLLNSCLSAQAYQVLTLASVRAFFASTNQLLHSSVTNGRTLACLPDPSPAQLLAVSLQQLRVTGAKRM